MFFIVTCTPEEEITDFREFISCPACGAYCKTELIITYSRLSFFFIPLYKLNKKYILKNSCCGAFCEIDKSAAEALLKGELGKDYISSLNFTRFM